LNHSAVTGWKQAKGSRISSGLARREDMLHLRIAREGGEEEAKNQGTGIWEQGTGIGEEVRQPAPSRDGQSASEPEMRRGDSAEPLRAPPRCYHEGVWRCHARSSGYTP
jgi:hypothetical protein